MRKHLEGFEEVNTSANTALKAIEKILKRAKLMEDGLADQVLTIGEEALKLKATANEPDAQV